MIALGWYYSEADDLIAVGWYYSEAEDLTALGWYYSEAVFFSFRKKIIMHQSVKLTDAI